MKYSCFLVPNDALAKIKWLTVRPRAYDIYFRTYDDCDELCAMLLKAIFERCLDEKFVCNYTYYFGCSFSCTISINDEHPFWIEHLAQSKEEYKMSYYVEDLRRLFPKSLEVGSYSLVKSN